MKPLNSSQDWIDTFPDQPVVYLMLTDTWIDGWVYAKIGKTEQLPIRHNKLEMASGRRLKIDHCVDCETTKGAFALERTLHNIFKPFRERGEWFFLPAEAIRFIRRLETPHDIVIRWHEGELQTLRFIIGQKNRPQRAA